MVEQDAVAGVHAVGLAVIHHDPVGVELGHGVGAARVEGRGFLLGDFLHQAIQLGCAGLVEAGFFLQPEDADGFEQAQRAQAVHVGGVFRAFKANSYVALRTQVVDLVRLGFLHDADQVAAVAEVAVVQVKAGVVNVRVLVDVVHALGVELAAAALDAVHDVALFQQQLGEVRAVLAGDAGDEGDFGLGCGVGVGGHWVCFEMFV